VVCCRAHTGICLLDFNNNIIIIIITDLYSAFRSKDTEVSRATVSRRWKSNCGSTDRDWPSTFAHDLLSMVTTVSFFLKVKSLTFFPVMDCRIFEPTSFALSAFTVLSAVTPVAMLCSELSRSKGFLCCRWSRRLLVSLASINVVALRQTRLVPVWVTDRLWTGKPSQYVTSQLGQLSLSFLRSR